MPNKITTLYSDSAKTNALYPRTYTTAVHDSNNNLQENVNQYLAGNFAQIETSPATSAHSVGDYIIYNYQLYKVISAIAVSDSLVVNTNIESANIIDNLCYKPGDTVTLTYVAIVPGFITASQKNIDFTIALDRPVLASSVSFTSLPATIRGISGYVLGSSAINFVSNQDYSVTAYVVNGLITVYVTGTNAVTTSNNTPVMVTLGAGTSFTFS